MALIKFCSWFMLAFSANAIDFLPCQRALVGNTFTDPKGRAIELSPNQVVVHGSLFVNFGETGMEGGAEYIVEDDLITRELVGHDRNFETWLAKDDLVYLMDKDGQLLTSGYHDLVDDPTFYPEVLPILNQDGLFEPASTPQSLFRFYQSQPRIIAVLTLTEKHLKWLDEHVEPLLKDLAEHKKDSSRFLSLGSTEIYERKMFEEVEEGSPKLNRAGEVYLETDEGAPVRITGRYRLFGISKKGLALGLVAKGSWPVKRSQISDEAWNDLWRVVLIRPKGDGKNAAKLELP